MTSYDRASGSSQVVTFRGAVEFGLPGPGGSIKNAVSVTPGEKCFKQRRRAARASGEYAQRPTHKSG